MVSTSTLLPDEPRLPLIPHPTSSTEYPAELVWHDRVSKDDAVEGAELVVNLRDVTPGGPAEMRSIEKSITELAVCQTIFTQWMRELNKCVPFRPSISLQTYNRFSG